MRASAASTSHQESCHGVQQTVRARRRSDLEQRKPTLSPNAVQPDLRGGPRRRDPHFGTRGRRRAARRSRGAQPRRGWRGARAGPPAAAPGPEPPARRRHARRPRADPRAARPLLPGAGGDRAAAGCAIPPRDSQGGPLLPDLAVSHEHVRRFRATGADLPQGTVARAVSDRRKPRRGARCGSAGRPRRNPAGNAWRGGSPTACGRPASSCRRARLGHARRCWPATRCPPSPGGSRCAKAPSRPT